LPLLREQDSKVAWSGRLTDAMKNPRKWKSFQADISF